MAKLFAGFASFFDILSFQRGTSSGAINIGGTASQVINIKNDNDSSGAVNIASGAGTNTSSVNIGTGTTTGTVTIGGNNNNISLRCDSTNSGSVGINSDTGGNARTLIGTFSTTGVVVLGGDTNDINIKTSNNASGTVSIATGTGNIINTLINSVGSGNVSIGNAGAHNQTITINGGANSGRGVKINESASTAETRIGAGTTTGSINIGGTSGVQNINIGVETSAVGAPEGFITIGNGFKRTLCNSLVDNIKSVATKEYVDANSFSSEILTTTTQFSGVISPTAKETLIINTFIKNAAFNLANPVVAYTNKTVRLSRGSYGVKIYTTTQTFFLQADNPLIELSYLNGRWERTDVFYPTSFEARLTLGIRGPATSPNGASYGKSVDIDGSGQTLAYISGMGVITVCDNINGEWIINTVLPSPSSNLHRCSLSNDGGFLVVSDILNDTTATDAGAVFVYVKTPNGWILSQTLTPSSAPNTQMGQSIAIADEGRFIVIGSILRTPTQGTVEIFIRNTTSLNWTNSVAILGGVNGTNFGASAAITPDGRLLAVGFTGTANPGFRIYRSSIVTGGVTHSWTQVGSDYTVSGGLGTGIGESICISRNGLRVAVGGSLDNGNIGAVWIFTSANETTWILETKLTPTGNVGACRFGLNVKLSDDGNTLVAAATLDNSSQGAVFVFKRSLAGVWSQVGNKLVGTGNTGAANQGSSVSISGTGNTIISGGSSDSSSFGAVWLFNRNEILDTWSQYGNKITQRDFLQGLQSVGPTDMAISGDGSTLAIGNNLDGRIFVYRKINNRWVPYHLDGLIATLGGGFTTLQGFGTSIALSNDGSTLAVGSTGNNSNTGAIVIFVRDGSGVYTQQTILLGTTNITGAATNSNVGSSVALSADGNTLAFGARLDNGSGAAWVFTRSGTTWSQQTANKLTGVSGSFFGTSIKLSADGNTLVVAAIYDFASGPGTLWIYKRFGTQWAIYMPGLNIDAITSGSTFGRGLSISGDGNIIAAGAPSSGSNTITIFKLVNGIWRSVVRQLKLIGQTGSLNYGASLKLSYYGDVLVTGAPGSNDSTGGVYIYAANNEHNYDLVKILSSDIPDISMTFSGKVDMSDDGKTVVTCPNFGNNNGASRGLWVFS